MNKFVSVQDVEDIDALVKKALQYKQDPLMDNRLGAGKNIGLLFLNPSMRTRISTQIAAQNLGLNAIVFNVDKEGWALEFDEEIIMNGTTVEHVKDAAPVMGKYFDILCIRTFPGLKNRDDDYSETIINAFIKHCGIPVVSLESATLHPLQSLADVITITEVCTQKGIQKPKVVLTWAPHIKPLPQCVGNSFAQWINAWGKADFIVTHPAGYELSEEFTRGATVMHNQQAALENADFVYVKNWSSFHDYGAMPGQHKDWMLTPESLAGAPDAHVMHCLPVRRNLELSAAVLDGPQSIVTHEGGNRVWSAQAVLAEILKAR